MIEGRGAAGKSAQTSLDSEPMQPTEDARARPGRPTLVVTASIIVSIAVSMACVALSWLGATGAVPWGYTALDHGPVWRQFAVLSAFAMLAVLLTAAVTDSTNSRRVLPAPYARRLGLTLCALVLALGLALVWFGLWGDASFGVVTLAAAAIAPALALAGGVTVAGALRRIWTSMAAAGAVIAVGAIATAWTFTS